MTANFASAGSRQVRMPGHPRPVIVLPLCVILITLLSSSCASSEHFQSNWPLLLLCAALGLVVVFQRVKLSLIQREAKNRAELFRLITENAADMIALVDVKGRRLYNSPAYRRTLGYSPAELGETHAFEQIHPEDRYKVLQASREAREAGSGKRLEYRIRHKDGTWRIFESTASGIRNDKGEVEKLVIVNRDITERRRAEEQIAHHTFHDALTGLPNRNLFVDRLQHCWARAKRSSDYTYAILLVDIDGFKALNEEIGRSTGDQLLIEIGRRISAALRNHDTVSRPEGKQPLVDPLLSRLGGDEFTILADGIRDPSDAMRVAQRIQTALSAPLPVDGREVLTSVSVGIALSTAPHDEAEELLRHAEIAANRAKTSGKARIDVFDAAMHSHAVNRLTLEADLHKAVEQEQFRLFYQPIVRLKTGEIAGFEALLRWNHPEQGLVFPNKFLPIAETSGVIIAIGEWVLRTACRQVAAWQAKFPFASPLTITVNISARQLSHTPLVNQARSAIRDAGIDPGSLQLEITESAAMKDVQLTTLTLSELKHLGVQISIDDFGTGQSSLSQLRRFPVSLLKVDRSFVNNMQTDRINRDVVRVIVSLAHILNVKVIAEGIESAAHVHYLKSIDCEFGQGYLFGRPMEAAKAEQMLATAFSAGGRILQNEAKPAGAGG
jgi:diguanylate cyclase (GGDEF)-like protein/PAS domain S-box-containing protein